MSTLIDKFHKQKNALNNNRADIDEMRGFYPVDIMQEMASGTDRGVMSIAVLLVESMLRSLYLSDPDAPTEAELAMVGKGGPLEGRHSLLDHLLINGFLGAETASAVAALFDCNDARLHWADMARFDASMIERLGPFLNFSYEEPIELPDKIDETNVRELFEFSLGQLLDRIFDHIANRDAGLE